MDNVEDDLTIEEPQEERQYSYREKALRDFYIKEYLVDYDEVAAATRVGYPKAIAREFAAKFMGEPYVLRRIKEQEGNVDPNSDDADVVKKRIMAALMREANYRGPGSSQSARVAALSRLATLNGMDPINKPKDSEVPLGEGTFVVPGVMTPEQWEQAAASQQEALVADTTIPSPGPSIH